MSCFSPLKCDRPIKWIEGQYKMLSANRSYWPFSYFIPASRSVYFCFPRFIFLLFLRLSWEVFLWYWPYNACYSWHVKLARLFRLQLLREKRERERERERESMPKNAHARTHARKTFWRRQQIDRKKLSEVLEFLWSFHPRDVHRSLLARLRSFHLHILKGLDGCGKVNRRSKRNFNKWPKTFPTRMGCL